MFEFLRMNNSAVVAPAIKQLQAANNVAYAVGDALVLAAGVLSKATGATKPTHIAAQKYPSTASAGKIAVYPINSDMEFKTKFAADGTAIVAGNLVTIHTDAAQITATTTSGVATVLEKIGTGAIGTEAIVKF